MTIKQTHVIKKKKERNTPISYQSLIFHLFESLKNLFLFFFFTKFEKKILFFWNRKGYYNPFKFLQIFTV